MICEAKLIEIIAEISRFATSGTNAEKPPQKLIYGIIEKCAVTLRKNIQIEEYAKLLRIEPFAV
ncbi:MAG: hypothetical protein L6V93_15085 [Clostridiales bacterium]|nr:MAG: hypothetical protein L6V93_15085 [Clostridiales bacterium]